MEETEQEAFFAVPSWGGGDGGLSAAEAGARVQAAGRAFRGKRARELAGQPSAAGAPAPAAGGKKARRGGAGAAAVAAEAAAPAEGDAEARVSGKNLGKRRRARERRERARAGGDGGGGEGLPAAAPRAKKKEAAKAAPQPEPAADGPAARAASKRARLAAARAAQRAAGAASDAPAEAPPPGPAAAAPPAAAARPTALDAATARLAGSRFRWLNEQLYTRSGAEAATLLAGDPSAFPAYHAGFRAQTAGWSLRPADAALAWLRRCPAWWRVADFGAGDGALGRAAPQGRAGPGGGGGGGGFHSFDLVASPGSGVVACDVAAGVPLADASVQAAVFCLSLMGTDYGCALQEAFRVLAPAGQLWIAEVRSRFEGPGGCGVDAFLDALKTAGFELRKRDEADALFVVLRLVKGSRAPRLDGPRWPPLKACEYKRR